jgi:hypothetical protein
MLPPGAAAASTAPSAAVADEKLMPPPPNRQTIHHGSHLSCPVDSDSPKRPNVNASNFSFDSG